MTRELLIIRHAKSSWAEEGLSDFDRPLNQRGLRDAPRMGRWLKSQGRVPDVIITSTACRAMETTDHIAAASGCENIETEDSLYHAAASTALLYVHGADADCRRIAVVAHNPGLEQLVEVLSGQAETMPTAAIALFTWEGDWKDLAPRNCKLEALWRPKELPVDFE